MSMLPIHRKFRCWIINDDGPKGNWSSFVEFLFHTHNYIEAYTVENVKELKSMEIEICSPIFNKTLSQGLDHLEKNADYYDFFVIDLDLSQKNFIDLDGFNNIETPDPHSMYFAGLKCFDYLRLNNSLKFICSGSDLTSNLYKHLSICRIAFAGRLRDIIFTRIDDHEAFQEIEEVIDSYLFRKQTEVVNRQDFALRQDLLNRVMQNRDDEGSAEWDKLLIPDNINQSSIEYWSLRSLFPKQVNSILDNSNVENSYDYIEKVLKADWRKEFKEICNHPTRLGEGECSLLRQALITLEFKKGRKAFDYRGLTECNAFPTSDSYNDQTWESLRIEACQSYADYFASKVSVRFSDGIEKLRSEAVWEDKLLYYARNFGIYPGDIRYLNEIAERNRCHVNDAPFFLRILDNKSNKQSFKDELIFIWCYNGQADSRKLDSFSEGNKFKNANNSPYLLDDGGMADAIRIACFRYRGKLELQTADRLLFVTMEKGITPLSPDTYKVPQGITEFRITIQKPIEWH